MNRFIQDSFLRHLKLTNLLCALFYIYIFRRIYIDYLVKVFGYMGYEANCTAYGDILQCDILSVMPILLYKPNNKVSDFISILIYILVYVPGLISMQYYFGCSKVIGYMLVFFISMLFFFRASSNKISQQQYHTKIGAINVKVFFYLGFIFGLLLLILFRNNLHMVSFSEVYDLRGEDKPINSAFPLVGYIQMWCTSLFPPLFIAVGLSSKNKIVILLGFLLSLLIYTSTWLKTSIINPFVILFFYWIIKKWMNKSIVLLFPMICVILGVLFFSSTIIKGEIARVSYALIFMRSIGIAAQLTPCYVSVFMSHPFTYYSHVNVINLVTGMYPFDNPSLGNAVWGEFSGNDTNNANANFLLTDGVAAGGIIGVLIITIVFYYVLVYLNKLTNIHDHRVVFPFLIPIIVSLTNASLFTTLLSSGLIFAMIIFRFCKLDILKPNNNLSILRNERN